jgi:hypothetical protein
MDAYSSSEEYQRHAAADAFAKTEAKKAEVISEKEKLKKSLDKYIAEHSSTTAVRALAVKNNRTNDYQMDLSADLVELLTKIKKGI